MAEAEPLRPRRVGRRTVLRATVALPALAGCAGFQSSVRVAVPWSGWELARFRKVLDAFTTDTGLSTEVVALGDDIGAVLGAKASGAPDVVMLPRPGLIREHEKQLEVVGFAWQGQFSEEWQQLVEGNEALLGVPFKAANKSVLWYRKDMLEREPNTWLDWMDICQKLIGKGQPPLALGAADGWPLSDLFENILLVQGQRAYRSAKNKSEWQGPGPVRAALQMLGELLSKDGVLVGGAGRALITQFEDSLLQVFKYGEAAMVVAPDFAYPVIERYARFDDNVGLARFPGLGSTVMAGGDIAVLPKSESHGGHELIKWLATKDAAERWARLGGFLAAHQDVPARSYRDPRLAKLARELHGGFEFDLSDELGPPAGDVLLRALQDFLVTVGDGHADRIEDAAQTVMNTVAPAVQRG